MQRPITSGVRLLLLAGALGIGCNSLVGNDTHQLDPTVDTGMGGTRGGGGSGPLGGAAAQAGGGHGGAVASGGVPAAGGAPAAGGGPGTGGAIGVGGAAATGGVSAGGHVGSGGIVATGGLMGSGGITGTAGSHGSGGASANGGAGGSGGVAGTGGAGGMCIAPGAACQASTDCCQTASTTPMGAICIADDGACHAKCTAGSQCVSGCCTPVSGETYGVCADAATYCPTLKGVGDPCAADSECASGSCNDWCQASCGAGNSTCSSTPSRTLNNQGQSNSCVFTQANTYSCFPGCLTDPDCTVYGTGYTCQLIDDVDGYYVSVCSL